MLIRKRLNTLKAICEEYNLDVTVHRVNSAVNRADALTRVLRKWLTTREKIKECHEGPRNDVACASLCVEEQHWNIVKLHHDCDHPGIRRTLYFARRLDPTIVRRQVQQVVSSCQVCRSVDPALGRWRAGVLEVKETWHRAGIDITHHASRPYLTLVDHGPSCFSIWRQLRRQTAACVVQQLESIFYERGAPYEILLDNEMAFRSKCFRNFAEEWGISLCFRCAYVASGNGIVDRCHRTVKTIAARKECTIAEVAYRYNTSPRDGSPCSIPASVLYGYELRVKDVDRSKVVTTEQEVYSR